MTIINNVRIVRLVPAALFIIVACLSSNAQSYYPAGLGNANLGLWLTASDPTTLLTSSATQAANGNSVATWKDKSGHSSNATQATVAAQPIYATAQMNGFGALIFQNNGQYLTGPSGTWQTIVSAREVLGALGNSTGNNFNYYYQTLFASPANADFSVRCSGNGYTLSSVAYTDGSSNSNDWSYNTGSPVTMWLNGVQGTTVATQNHILVDEALNSTTNTYSISTTYSSGGISRGMYANDPVYELLAYQSVLSVTQRHLLENYLATEWGMTAYLPSSGYTVFTPPSVASFNRNLVGIGYTASTDNFLANPAGSTDGLGFSTTSGASGFLNTAGYVMAAHNGQSNTVVSNANVPGITSAGNITIWNRSWYVQESGGNNAGQLTLNFNFSDYNGSTPHPLIISACFITPPTEHSRPVQINLFLPSAPPRPGTLFLLSSMPPVFPMATTPLCTVPQRCLSACSISKHPAHKSMMCFIGAHRSRAIGGILRSNVQEKLATSTALEQCQQVIKALLSASTVFRTRSRSRA